MRFEETQNNPTSPETSIAGRSISVLRWLLKSPGTTLPGSMALIDRMNEIEIAYQLDFSAARHQRKRLGALVNYVRDFPGFADCSDWVSEQVLNLWRMGDEDSLSALSAMVRCRQKPGRMRSRMKQAKRAARLAIYNSCYGELTGQYAKIKEWISDERRETPGISRKELWIRWLRVTPDEQQPPIDRDHFFKLARSKHRYYTPAYVARSYLRGRLNLPDRVVSRIRSQPSLRGMRIQLHD